MKKSNAFQRGFTLIELMIVIVILGILMGTILPRLTGAQARARDTARRADLTNISQALEVYFADFGAYPPAPSNGTAHGCLDEALDTSSTAQGGSTTAVLGGYMKGSKVPAAVSANQVTLGCTGSYFYKPLNAGGATNGGYVLASDMETFQLANHDIGAGTANYAYFSGEPKDITIAQPSAENADKTKTIYVVTP